MGLRNSAYWRPNVCNVEKVAREMLKIEDYP